MSVAQIKDPTRQELLDHVEWLADLPLPYRERVYEDVYETTHEKGDSVARLGDPSDSWIGVAEGLLKVTAVSRSGKSIMYTGVSRGGWIGEGAVIKRELRRYNIVAMRHSRLLHLPSSTFRWLMDTSIEFNHVIVTHLNERLSQFISTVEIDRLEDPAARVAKMLAMMFNPLLYPRMPALVPLCQAELGELVGLSRQSVSAALKRLEKDGCIEVAYGGIAVRNVMALRNYDVRETLTD